MGKKTEIKQYENEVIIHQDIARLRGRLTTIQSKSMLSILKRANEQVEKNPDIVDFTIPTDTFLKDIQNKDTAGIVIKRLHKNLRELMVQTFIWGTEEELNECIFIQQIKVTNTEVTFKFSDYIREHIKPISNALIVKDFELVQSFRSEYARQLYKHIMMWEDRQTLYLSLKDFKDFLGVPDKKSYNRMDNLKRKVIEVALKEINEKCPWMDLRYTNKTKPRSRAIEGFHFAWFKKTKGEKDPLKSEKNFIEYIRKNYKANLQENIFPTIIETKDGNLKINFKGNLYLVRKNGATQDYDHIQSQKLWSWLYGLAKDGREF